MLYTDDAGIVSMSVGELSEILCSRPYSSIAGLKDGHIPEPRVTPQLYVGISWDKEVLHSSI